MKLLNFYIFCILISLNYCNIEASNKNDKKTEIQVEKISKIKNVNFQDLEKVSDIPLPEGFERLKTDSNSFEYYLQNFKLRTSDKTVYLYNGEPKSNQNVQYAVLDIDVGTKDLQQCADAVMRLRGEYLYSKKKYSEIHFNFLSDGKPRYFLEYSKNDTSYKIFRKYMDYIFSYANTGSLNDEMKSVAIDNMQIGDVFIQKRTPYGHAIIVLDMAENFKTNQKIFIIAQSYMPAQDIHILLNFNNTNISPWYELDFKDDIETPEWIFTKSDLKRF